MTGWLLIPGAPFHPIPSAGHLVQEDAPEASSPPCSDSSAPTYILL